MQFTLYFKWNPFEVFTSNYLSTILQLNKWRLTQYVLFLRRLVSEYMINLGFHTVIRIWQLYSANELSVLFSFNNYNMSKCSQFNNG